MSMKHRIAAAQEGFTMVVIAGLFAAFSVVAAIAIDRGSITKQIDQQAATRAQLSRLSKAVLKYYNLNSGKYPCPAPFNVLRSASGYGVENINCGSGTPAGMTFIPNGVNTDEVLMGMIPIATLGAYGADLSDATDAWGDRIMYVVNRELTSVGSGTGLVFPIVRTLTGTATNSPDFMVISFGPDKIGAIPKLGTAVVIPCATSTDIRKENCDNDIEFVFRPFSTAPNATAAGTYPNYDDIISFYASH